MRWISLLILSTAAGCEDPRLMTADGGGGTDAGAMRVDDAGHPPPPDGAVAPDAGRGSEVACVVEEAQEVSGAPDDCGLPSIALDGTGTPHLAWVTAFPNRGRYAFRAPSAWTTTDAFLPGVQRVSLAVDAAGAPVAVAHEAGGRASLWTGRPLSETLVFRGVNILPAGRAIAIDDAGDVHLALRFTDDSSGEFMWGVDYYTGRSDALVPTRLAIARNSTALDLALDPAGEPALLYTLDADYFVSRPPGARERIAATEPFSLQLGSSGAATMAVVSGTVHVLGQRGASTPWRNETFVLTRSAAGVFRAATIAVSEVGSCPDPDGATAGDRCIVDNVHWGRSATLVGRASDAIVLIARSHETGTKTFRCGLVGERECDWTGETTFADTLWAGVVGGETVELHEVGPLDVGGTIHLNAVAGVDDVLHAGFAESWYPDGEVQCRMRYARIRCDRR